jgi:thiol-disulfide isomerase/thioredoxin
MRLGRREFLALGAIGGAAAAAGALLGVLGLQGEGSAEPLLAESFVDLDGRPTRLGDWSSPVLLCNFWATWCDPCREEVPLLVAARQRFAPNGFEVAGIGVDNAAKLRQFAKDYDVPYPVLVAGGGAPDLLRVLGNKAAALPYSVIVDRQRRITYRKLGAWKKAELEREIRAAIG